MNKKPTRGIRNNNPLNIKIAKKNNWKGRVPVEQNTDGVFEQFTTMTYGVRAALKLLKRYVSSGYNTIPLIIGRWCPPLSPKDDSTRIYIDYVMKACRQERPAIHGLTTVSVDDRELLRMIVSAMCRMESNYRLPEAVFNEAWGKP